MSGAALVAPVLAGDRRALARALSAVEAGTAAGQELVRALYPRAGRAHVVGVTGPAGSGKSTLVGALARAARRRGRTVGVVAVDPSSPYTQGALLGDRIRMQDLAGDPGVFVRSMATRGALGGLAPATADAVTVLDAAGYDLVLVETVGAGQDEVEVAGTAHTTVVVQTPGQGDEVQALKAGILEVADVLVVNKADLPGADRVVAQLRGLLELAGAEPAWRVPVLAVVAARDEGVEALLDAVEGHRAYLAASGRLGAQAQARAERQVLGLARERLLGAARAALGEAALAGLVAAVAAHELDPHTAADRLVAALLQDRE